MVFNARITRADAAALIPEEVSDILLGEIAATNPILQLARRLPNMARAQTRMPVIGALAQAYFVAGDGGLKQTTEVSWENRFIDAEEVAVIVPIPENVLDDADYPIWDQVRPEIVNAFNATIMGALLYGTNIPATWTVNLGGAGILNAAPGAHVISAAAFADLYEAIMGEDAAANPGVIALVEEDGFMVNGHVAHLRMRGRLRNVRDALGQPIFTRAMQDASRYELDGEPVYFPTDGVLDPAQSWMFSGDWSQLVWAIRKDMTFKLLDQAVIQDAAGNIVFNLAQQDMVALRAVMRLGVSLPNPINRVNPTAATRFPFAVLTA